MCGPYTTKRGKIYIKTTDKNGKIATFSITGNTVYFLLEYISRHSEHPAPFLFRYTKKKKKPHVCLGSERLAKRALLTMEKAGIPIQTFKAHSFRGATASKMLKREIPQEWVVARGGWGDSKTLYT